jgi:hypothetical protein
LNHQGHQVHQELLRQRRPKDLKNIIYSFLVSLVPLVVNQLLVVDFEFSITERR